jgi:hypothetical protein
VQVKTKGQLLHDVRVLQVIQCTVSNNRKQQEVKKKLGKNGASRGWENTRQKREKHNKRGGEWRRLQ